MTLGGSPALANKETRDMHIKRRPSELNAYIVTVLAKSLTLGNRMLLSKALGCHRRKNPGCVEEAESFR